MILHTVPSLATSAMSYGSCGKVKSVSGSLDSQNLGDIQLRKLQLWVAIFWKRPNFFPLPINFGPGAWAVIEEWNVPYQHKKKMAESADQIVLSFYDSLLRRSDVELLQNCGWLNDRIIAFYFE